MAISVNQILVLFLLHLALVPVGIRHCGVLVFLWRWFLLRGPSVIPSVLLISLVHRQAVEMLPLTETIEVVHDDLILANLKLELRGCTWFYLALRALEQLTLGLVKGFLRLGVPWLLLNNHILKDRVVDGVTLQFDIGVGDCLALSYALLDVQHIRIYLREALLFADLLTDILYSTCHFIDVSALFIVWSVYVITIFS